MKVCVEVRRFLQRGLKEVPRERPWCCTELIVRKLMTLMDALRAEHRKQQNLNDHAKSRDSGQIRDRGSRRLH